MAKDLMMSLPGDTIESKSNEFKACSCGCQPTFKKTTSTPRDPNKRTSTVSQAIQSIAAGNVDKRVSLTVSPKTYQRDESLFIKKVQYVLGNKTENVDFLKKGAHFYGLLRNALGTSSGLIFPYTPTVSFNHQTNYSPIEIIHSNITYNYYKNSPPPSIGLTAKFTADNRDNALHMLSAIWFLVACSKCDFGEKSPYAGLPPPVLYLNGYDSLMDNIPVVITSVRYSYPETKHYVNLVVDFSKEYKPHVTDNGFEWQKGDTTWNDTGFCRMYTSSTASLSESQKKGYGKSTANGSSFANATAVTTSQAEELLSKGFNETWKSIAGTEKTDYKNDGIVYSFWLPTDIQIDIGLAVQPNLLKTRKQWTLSGYKSGVLITNSGKNPMVTIPGKMDYKTLSSITQYNLKYTQQDNIDNVSDECKCLTGTDKLGFIPSGWTW